VSTGPEDGGAGSPGAAAAGGTELDGVRVADTVAEPTKRSATRVHAKSVRRVGYVAVAFCTNCVDMVVKRTPTAPWTHRETRLTSCRYAARQQKLTESKVTP
jgi:hypothetical protein